MSYFVIITIIFTLTNTITSYPQTLRLVSLMYRHGDRAPHRTFPTNPVPVLAWPNGLGALTAMGIRQQYRLGKYIRERYRGFINESYVASEIRVRSTDMDRTLMSAETNLAGLYPPSGYQKWSETILWQPIPVHTVPLKEDNLLYMGVYCPRLADLYKASRQTLKIIKENRQVLDYVAEKTGADIKTLPNLYSIKDAIQCQSVHGYPPPSWYNETLNDQINTIINYEYVVNFSSIESTRLSIGSLLREITENMVDKSKNVNGDAKMFMYSAHDETLDAFLTTLQIDINKLQMTSATTVFVELHESISQGLYVKVLYKNQPMSSRLRTLIVKGCTAECPLNTFRALTKKYIPSDWKKECGFPEVNAVNHNSKLSSPTETRSSLPSKTRSSMLSETRSTLPSETGSATICFMVLCYLSGVVSVVVVMLIMMHVRHAGYNNGH